jgi:aspartate/methionine/tyrosine aminotransferase
MNNAFKKRSKIMFEQLNKLDLISCNDPQGAFYCFPNISKLNFSSLDFQNKLLNETGIAAIAGTSFGEFGEGYLRFSCASSEESIKRAIEKLSLLLSNI